eukprot:SAG31_NODE_21173_length_556_cov_0.789934_1_plen_43_part_10
MSADNLIDLVGQDERCDRHDSPVKMWASSRCVTQMCVVGLQFG